MPKRRCQGIIARPPACQITRRELAGDIIPRDNERGGDNSITMTSRRRIYDDVRVVSRRSSHANAIATRARTIVISILVICYCLRGNDDTRTSAVCAVMAFRPAPVSVAVPTTRTTTNFLTSRPSRGAVAGRPTTRASIPPRASDSAADDDASNAATRSNASDTAAVSTVRSRIRRCTGILSLTTFRSTIRSMTGFSLTALRTTLRLATGISLSGKLSEMLRYILEWFSPALRYFLQPLLVAYYVPLLILRYRVVGPTKTYDEEGRRYHEVVVDGWRRAVEAAERANAGGYWPVHLNGEGGFFFSFFPSSRPTSFFLFATRSMFVPPSSPSQNKRTISFLFRFH